MKIPRAMPETVFAFIEAVQRLEPCTIEQVRAELRAQWPPVRSSKTFAQHFGLIESSESKISLTNVCLRMLRYSGTKRTDFLISHVRMAEIEPLRYLANALKTQDSIEKTRVAEVIRNKFDPSSRWRKAESEEISECYARWLELLRLTKEDSTGIHWIGGGVSAFDVTALAELDILQDRAHYDFLIENFSTPKNMLDEPHSILSSVASEKDDKRRGELFEGFLVSCFKLLGFNPRSRAGPRERGTSLSYQSTKGGGDVVLLSHFPVNTVTKEFVGCSLACEAKSTEGQVGSKAVGQARNLKTKIEETYPNYLVYPIVISRAKYGYDGSGRDIAPPEVILLNQDIILEVCKLQKERLERGDKLLLPVHIMAAIEEFIRSEKLEPSVDEVRATLNAILKQ